MTGRNRLAEETSPYLRQHADNPVDWYPGGDEAFARAAAEGKPVLLSVGYSACHWCHVMAHESFEDPGVAEVMNRLYVSVKVDREERPDVDAVYMEAVQAMTGRGGWPMTVFLTPEGRPFYGGTYFPKEDRHGLPSFVRLLQAIEEAWRTRRAEVLTQAERLTGGLGRAGQLAASGDQLSLGILDAAVAHLERDFDPVHGGFGPAPKFPQPRNLELLLRSHLTTGSPRALQMAVRTLDEMASGGLYDQLDGGFHRYSVDPVWLVPHFEKMLYDQAGLTRAYLRAHQVTGDMRHLRIVEETIQYVLTGLAHPDGGFLAAEDADSEGVEGRFYVWSAKEFAVVTGEDAEEAGRFFGVTEEGNFEGTNILRLAARDAGDPNSPRSPDVERARAALLEARSLRVRPGLDDKVLLAWNALFLDALTEAAASCDRPDWMEAARRNAQFLVSELRRPDGRWLRSWQSGTARHLAYAEDYAALLEALVTLAELDDVSWIAEARRVADGLMELFSDPERGGFFTSGSDAPPLVVRGKDLFDGATPSANSLAANGLLRLAALTGDTRYEKAGNDTLALLAKPMRDHPSGFAHLMEALERQLLAPLEIAVVGDRQDPAAAGLWRAVAGRLLPATVRVRGTEEGQDLLTPLLAGRPLSDTPVAYVCERYACLAPVASPEKLTAAIDSALAARRPPQTPSG
ncbi:MAG: thioredoxin domain-containing protein [Acidimicrobiia bacterium]